MSLIGVNISAEVLSELRARMLLQIVALSAATGKMWMVGKRPREGKRLGKANEFLKESSYEKSKSKAENRKEWRIWKPRTCLTAKRKRRRRELY